MKQGHWLILALIVGIVAIYFYKKHSTGTGGSSSPMGM